MSILLLLAACSRGRSSSSVAASSYDQSCQRSGDCTPIFEGEIAGCPSMGRCANAAIRQDAAEAYLQDVETIAGGCPVGVTGGLGPTCPGGVLTCPTGKCEFHPWGLDPDGGNPRAVAADE